MNNPELQKAIKKKQILPFSDAPKLIPKSLKEARDDLQQAKESYKNEKFKWATVQAYYAMFHAFRALLYHKKYREKSHGLLGLAIKILYVDEEVLAYEYYKNFMFIRELRELADYKGEYSQGGAQRAVHDAEKAISEAAKILSRS